MKALKFEEILSEASSLDENELRPSRQQPVEIEVEVAGPRESVEHKTLNFFVNNAGLIYCKFKEGGQLPSELKGQFTGINTALSAVNIWKNRASKEAEISTEIKTDSSNDGVAAPSPSKEKLDDLISGLPNATEEDIQRVQNGMAAVADNSIKNDTSIVVPAGKKNTISLKKNK